VWSRALADILHAPHKIFRTAFETARKRANLPDAQFVSGGLFPGIKGEVKQ
jgi:hypothetical protein